MAKRKKKKEEERKKGEEKRKKEEKGGGEEGREKMDAMQFFMLSLKDHKDAWERYLKLVRRAGLASYTELMQTAGLKVPFEDGSIKAIAQEMGAWIAEHQV